MKVCMIQSYSKNNENLFNLTVGNHIKYCNIHQYSFLAKNEQYTKFVNMNYISNILKNFDLVFTIGSDVIITNLNKKIETFLDNEHDIAICQEGHVTTLVNGEILLFKNTKNIFKILKQLDQFQLNNNNIYQGSQGIFNKLFFTHNKLSQYIQLIQPGTLQKYIYIQNELYARKQLTNNILNNNNYANYIKNTLQIDSLWIENIVDFDKIIWKDRNDFSAHALGTHTNQEKFKLCLQLIAKYPDLITL